MRNDLNRLKQKYQAEFAYILGIKLLGDFFYNVDDFFNFIEEKVNEFLDSTEKNYEQFIIEQAEIEKNKRKFVNLGDEEKAVKEKEVLNKIAYQFEVGKLLEKNDDEYYSYNKVWDYNNGYYNEDLGFYLTLEEAKEYVQKYLQNGNKNTYGIISKVIISEEDYNKIGEEDEYMIPEQFDLDKVIYSAYKVNDNLISENFVKNERDMEYVRSVEYEEELEQ